MPPSSGGPGWAPVRMGMPAGPRPAPFGGPRFPPAAPPAMRRPELAGEPDWARHIRLQVEFYFSAENVARDTYLRSLMGRGGFVLLGKLAQFRRVAAVTGDISSVLAAVSASPQLEVLVHPSGDATIALVRGRASWHLAQAAGFSE